MLTQGRRTTEKKIQILPLRFDSAKFSSGPTRFLDPSPTKSMLPNSLKNLSFFFNAINMGFNFQERAICK